MHFMATPCHLATANDYLAQRDAEMMRPLFESLGLTTGFVTSGMSQDERRAAYSCDITYGTDPRIRFRLFFVTSLPWQQVAVR